MHLQITKLENFVLVNIDYEEENMYFLNYILITVLQVFPTMFALGNYFI